MSFRPFAALLLVFYVCTAGPGWCDQVQTIGKQPQGIKFADEWTLRWGESMEVLAAHFAVDRSAPTLIDTRKSGTADNAWFDKATGKWHYYNFLVGERPPDAGLPDVNRLPLNCSLDDRGGGCRAPAGSVAFPYARALAVFDQQGRFYEVTLKFMPDAYDLILKMLETALGKPLTEDRSTLQNAFGAQFDQEIAIWKIEAVAVDLRKRSEDGVDTGWLTMTYEPIAPKSPPLHLQNPF